MLRITGYSDKYSVCPGDNIQFYINSENNEVYETQIVIFRVNIKLYVIPWTN